jgi:hypothetical protein
MEAASVISFLLVVATATATAPTGTVVRLNLDTSRAGLLTVSKLSKEAGVAPTARMAAEKGKAIYAKAKVVGDTMTLEFIEPPPAGTKTVTLPNDVQLDEDGACSLARGTYTIDYGRAKTGEVKVPMIVNSALEKSIHHRRPSKR